MGKKNKTLQEQRRLTDIAYIYAISAHAIDKKVSTEKALALIRSCLGKYIA